MKILVLNSGSSSLKFEIAQTDAVRAWNNWPRSIARGAVKGFGTQATLELERNGAVQRSGLPAADASEAVSALLRKLQSDAEVTGAEPLLASLDAVGHRIVHGGGRFDRSVVLDDETTAVLEELEALAPLHNRVNLDSIRTAYELFGRALPQVGVFDTAFFHTLPRRAATYAIPLELSERHGIRRFGFHGISHAYLAVRYAELTRQDARRPSLITLHLGSGCSAAAIRANHPMDTSMGFTPLEGLVMATRSGDLDPAIVGFLVRREGVRLEEVEAWLNRRSGLLGLTEGAHKGTSDMQEILARAAAGETPAQMAIDLFCYRVRKYVGAYMAALGGTEAVVFAGGIGENSPEVRARICEGMEWCGLRLDPEANAAAIGREAQIGVQDAGIQAWVIPTREERWIAWETAQLLTRLETSDSEVSRT